MTRRRKRVILYTVLIVHMYFQGPKESVKKLNETVLALENSEKYQYVVQDWRYCLDKLHALREDGGRAELRIDTESSGNITGMPEYFQEFVDFAPELEAVYSDHSLEADDFRNILYSKPGDSGKDAVELGVYYYRSGGDRIHLSPDGWKCYHSNEEDEDIDEPEISLEDVEELRKIGWGERDEPLIFTARLSQENICQGGFHPKDEIPPINWNLLFREERKDSFTDCLVFIIMNVMRAV